MEYRRYKVSVDRNRCADPMSCRVCLDICPHAVFMTYPKGGKRRRNMKSSWVIHPGFGTLCDGCGVCIPACPGGAIQVSMRKSVLQIITGRG